MYMILTKLCHIYCHFLFTNEATSSGTLSDLVKGAQLKTGCQLLTPRIVLYCLALLSVKVQSGNRSHTIIGTKVI